MHPKVFISHASEDKERFVIEFAKNLRSNGVDAWLDKWEMLPGDSLIDKIFEEGLKDADAVVIVLSKFSIEKPWVREELNASIVSKISNGTRIIPIVLDNCSVPESLKHTLWETITELDDYSDSFSRITSSIFGVTDKPKLGTPPSHVASVYSEISGLAKSDNLILKASCEHTISETHSRINPSSFFTEDNNFGLSEQEISDCVDILAQNGFLKVSKYMGGGCQYSITTHGFEIYCQAYLESYDEYVTSIASGIVNKSITSNTGLCKEYKIPLKIVNHVLERLDLGGHIRTSKLMGGAVKVNNVSPSLRRWLN